MKQFWDYMESISAIYYNEMRTAREIKKEQATQKIQQDKINKGSFYDLFLSFKKALRNLNKEKLKSFENELYGKIKDLYNELKNVDNEIQFNKIKKQMEQSIIDGGIDELIHLIQKTAKNK